MQVSRKPFVMRAVYPSGEAEVLVDVPRYDFVWQLICRSLEQKFLPKGTKIECLAATVRCGEQSWEEMMLGFFGVLVEPAMDAGDVMRGRRKVAGVAKN